MRTNGDGGAAFPSARTKSVGTAYEHDLFETGMTLRDYFAGQALQGMCAEGTIRTPTAAIAVEAYSIADAMLEARKQ